MCGNCTVHGGPHISPRESRRRTEPSTSARVPVVLRFDSACSGLEDRGRRRCRKLHLRCRWEWLGTQRVFVAVMAGLAAQAAHFAKRSRPQTIAEDGPAASAEDLDEQHPCVHHCDQQAQQDAGDQPVEPAAHPKHQRHSAD
jgi:hypothetical protein